jgi:adenylyltransferase/sulfurtransferase
VLPGIIGLLQANEAVKLILGLGEPLTGRLLVFDALTTEFRELKLKRDPNCPACGAHAHLEELPDYDVSCAIPVSR